MINPIIQQFEELDLLSKEIIKQQVEQKQGKASDSIEGQSPKRQKHNSVRSKGSKENSSKSNQNFGIKIGNSVR